VTDGYETLTHERRRTMSRRDEAYWQAKIDEEERKLESLREAERRLDAVEARSKRDAEKPKKSLARQAGEFLICCVLFAVLYAACDDKKAGPADQRGQTVPAQRGVTEPREKRVAEERERTVREERERAVREEPERAVRDGIGR
jgi:hypothetical protein